MVKVVLNSVPYNEVADDDLIFIFLRHKIAGMVAEIEDRFYCVFRNQISKKGYENLLDLLNAEDKNFKFCIRKDDKYIEIVKEIYDPDYPTFLYKHGEPHGVVIFDADDERYRISAGHVHTDVCEIEGRSIRELISKITELNEDYEFFVREF